MKRNEIEDKLSKCSNLVELVRCSNELKKAGANVNTVNKLVTKFKKQLMSNTRSFTRIQRNTYVPEEVSKVSYVNFQVQFIMEPIVVYDGNNTVII